MTIGANPNLSDSSQQAGAADEFVQNWRDVRANEDTQFEPLELAPPDLTKSEPSGFIKWLNEALGSLLEFIASLFSWVPGGWPIVKWVLLAIAILGAIFIIYRLVEPLIAARSGTSSAKESSSQEWRPDTDESLALLDDADRLAAQGKYDEATHLLLQRSVGQMANARPDWVEPSSTARELTRLSDLPEKARKTFAIIATNVERSLFAMRPLQRADWEEARAAYADFALTRLDGDAA